MPMGPAASWCWLELPGCCHGQGSDLFMFGGGGDGAQGLTHARQALYREATPQPGTAHASTFFLPLVVVMVVQKPQCLGLMSL